MFDPEQITFTSLQAEDYVLITKWLNLPHVHKWYDKDEINTLEEVSKRYDFEQLKEPTYGFIVHYTGKPVGYIQKYYPKDWKEFRDATGYADGIAGIDLFVGEPDFIGKGFGTLMIQAFLHQIVFQELDITMCIIDPEPENKRAIRTYEKVGFTYVRTAKIPEEKDLAYLMELKKEDLVLDERFALP